MSIPERYTQACDDIFSYKMGDGPSGVPRMFVVRTWLRRWYDEEQKHYLPIAWLINAMRLAEAKECSEIIRNIMAGIMEDGGDGSITDQDADHVLDQIKRRVRVLDIDEAKIILGDLDIPVFFVPYAHDCVEHIDVIPFTVETGFSPSVIAAFHDQIPV